MPPKRKKVPKRLKQTTLIGVVITNPPSSTATPSTRSRRTDKKHQVQLKSAKLETPHAPSESDVEVVTQSSKKRRRAVVHSDSDESPTLNTRDKSKGPNKRITRRKTAHPIVTSDSESEEPPPPRKKLHRGPKARSRTPTASEGETSDDLESDNILESRLRSRGKASAYQQGLEKLRRRKAGLQEISSESSEESSNPNAPFEGARPSSDRDSLFDESSDAEKTSDFIVDDEGSGQVQVALPYEFSGGSYEDLDQKFRRIFQFFVHIAVRAPKERHGYMERVMREDSYVSMPLQHLRRKLSGIRDSQVASSIWVATFRKSVEKYPELDLTHLDFSVPGCDACALGARTSTIVAHLHGGPYDKLGFENIENYEEDEDDDDEKEPPSFNLGRFCARRTQVFHKFTHWEYSLFSSIRQEVNDLHMREQGKGYFPITYAGGHCAPEDLTDADAIYEWLDGRRITDLEWEKIHNMMESAGNLDKRAEDSD